MLRICSLLFIFALTLMQVYAEQAQIPFEQDIEHFEAQDAVHPPTPGGIVFVGSSSIVRWSTLKTDFPNYNCINRGFGGSQVSDSVRFADRIVTPYKPKIIVFFAGTNDIAGGKSGDTVFDDYKQFVGRVRAKLPNTKIIYISISPAPSRQVHWDEMRKANRLIKDFCHHGQNLLFMDVWDQFLTPTGGPRPELFVEDQLHLKPAGYAIWVKNLTPVLERLSRE